MHLHLSYQLYRKEKEKDDTKTKSHPQIALPLGRSWAVRSSFAGTSTCGCIQFSSVQFSSVQSLSRIRLFATPWIAARQASLSITNSRSSLRLVSIESVMPSSHLILCHPLLLLPPVPPSLRVFSTVLLIELQTLFDFYQFSHSCPFAISIQPRLTYLINCCLLCLLQSLTVT